MTTEAPRHTPGPWQVSGARGERKLYGHDVGPDGNPVATVDYTKTALHEKRRGRSAAECFRNARLIAAAPDLLAALKRAVTYVELTYDEEGGEEAAEAKRDLDMCNAAIRKARGS